MIRKAHAGDVSELSWFKSSYSSGSEGDSCVEVALEWRKSSYSSSDPSDCVEVAQGWQKRSHSSSNESGDCVEIAATPRTIHVRDSKAADGPCVTLTPNAWSDFLTYASRD
ncbi:DUF397 domain-containing protein [Streptomyces alfalfae]|uniref:DUF397 domain-containing protein n=1 Tax=Streptomyces alfalfae TaxID=1642299 RepID=A0ABM6GWL0_9ACTN|nr:DUF397 domain-containing protein [Streptomyces alfalfae]APY88058.1 DUF397 domain-containing protein [Streptomyces alfalfae]AYA18438.1 DUF397 domain-containing protein [Streptomyces fradiae]RXX46155.1 DUF397 domain-containing protein [Streptomyces alfalfae]RZM92176.1 DUF397 domain-containing protein [Streptomyces alfalfae]